MGFGKQFHYNGKDGLTIQEVQNMIIGFVGQCDLNLGSSHYIRADTSLPGTHTDDRRCKYPDQPDMLDAINYTTK